MPLLQMFTYSEWMDGWLGFNSILSMQVAAISHTGSTVTNDSHKLPDIQI